MGSPLPVNPGVSLVLTREVLGGGYCRRVIFTVSSPLPVNPGVSLVLMGEVLVGEVS